MHASTRTALALATVYAAWGSSYLAIGFAVKDVEPLPFSASRFLLVSLLLMAVAAWRKEVLPGTRRDWLIIMGVGILLSASSGLVPWAQQWVSSGQAALIMASAALWTAWFGTWGRHGDPLSPISIAGLCAGFIGVALIVGDGVLRQQAPFQAYLALVAAPIFWAGGSMLLRRYPIASGTTITIAIQALMSGLIFSAIGGSAAPPLQAWTLNALIALAYLVLFGSIIGYGAYFWLIPRVQPVVLGTFSYVNPLLALLLGYWFLEETMSPLQLLGAIAVIASVAAILFVPLRPPEHRR